MKKFKPLLSIVLSVGTALSSINSTHGSGILAEMTGLSMMRRAGYMTVSAHPLRHYQHSPIRHYASAIFKGKYVSASSEGIVTIKQEKYPKYSGVQHLRLNPKIISELRIDKGNGMPYHLVDFNDLEGPFEGTTRIETIMDSSVPFTIIDTKESKKKPYSSIGRLEMFFPKGDKESGSSYYGSGAALDKNLVITAAHNFLPPQFNDHPNTGRIRAEEVRFHHMLTTATVSNQHAVRSARVSTHCFIHPEWEKSFNPDYDVALVFLSESLNLIQAQIDELLKLKILNGKEETIRIIGHPNGTVNMSESKGKTSWEQTVDSQNILYHLANTLPGSSGSPIISDDLHVIGTHTRGVGEETNGANSGVRMRLELLPFIDHSITIHQEFLANMDQIEEFQQREKQRQEQALIDKGIDKGIIEGEKAKAVEIARNLKSMNLTTDQIKAATGLTEDEISAIK
ncbi:MAG: trypsin-like peptidase domain-containing protein [Alphaproteobacteria bacterium]|nr:trypsin-like peptidase domain-containing protein [Alphaproteobacteria bacterium]